ncbi:MAG: mechanosensitive ion channel domain-containing protein, partial [Waterburya sp.]
MPLYSQLQKYCRFIFLIGITCLLIVIPTFAHAQTNDLNTPSKASVVVDGQVLFQVGNFGVFSAHERADQINQSLIDTLRTSKEITIDLVIVDEQITIQNMRNKQHLLTVTQADVISASNPYNQALLWKDKIQKTLNRGQKERTASYQTKAFLTAFLVTLIAIAINLAIQFLRSLSARRVLKISKKQTILSSWHRSAVQWFQFILLALQLGMWIYGFVYITNLFPQTRSWRYWLNSPLINFDSKSYSALELLLLLGLTVLTWFVIRTITNLLKYYILNKTITESAIQDLIAICLQYIFTSLGLIILWQSWGIDVRALAITASVVGVGIGFGLQNIANNFISGLILTLERPIKVGDLIKVDDLIGTVKNIGARSTEILTPDHITIIVPNSQLLGNQLINWNHRDSLSRLRIPVGVSYNSDLRKVKTALLCAAKNHSEVLSTPRPQIFFQKFNDSSLDFELLVWIKDPKKQFRITSDLN